MKFTIHKTKIVRALGPSSRPPRGLTYSKLHHRDAKTQLKIQKVLKKIRG